MEMSKSGESEWVRLVGGKKVLVREWGKTKDEWRFTANGRAYYKDRVVRHTVSFPTREIKTRINDTQWVENSWIASTAF